MDRLEISTSSIAFNPMEKALILSMTNKGIRIHFGKEGLTCGGEDATLAQLLLSVMGAFAEFERSVILERQREGIALAKAKGVYKGMGPSLSPDQVAEARRRILQGVPKAKVVRDLGVSRQTIYSAFSIVQAPALSHTGA